MNLLQKIHLKIWGYYEDDGKTYMKCLDHGVTEAYIHGWGDNVGCVKCLRDRLESA
jgi:hypothetical protein